MVELSPPGRIIPSISSNCARSRTYTGVAPARSNAAPWAAKSPCSESTPTLFATLFSYQPRVCNSSPSGIFEISSPGIAAPSERLASSNFSGLL